MQDKIKILFILTSLSYGGEERLVVDQLKALDNRKYRLSVIYYEKREDLLFDIPPHVSVYRIEKKKWTDFFLLVWQIRCMIKKINPHIVFSTVWYNTLIVSVAKYLLSTPFYYVAREPHNHMKDIENTRFKIIKKYIIKWSHKIPNIVIIVSRGAADEIISAYQIRKENVKVIYNSVDIKNISILKNKCIKSHNYFDNSKINIVTLGRLTERKGYADLLIAFKKIRKHHKANMIFIGDGEEKDRLIKMSESMNLQQDVHFLGKQKNPYNTMARCDIFIMSSLREGFGNVIIEAMACGIPVISTNCPHGPGEIITSGENGLLVPVKDTDALAKTMDDLIYDREKRLEIAERGKKRAEDFSLKKIIRQYEEIYEKAAARQIQKDPV